MILELGPVPAGDVQSWSRFARRLVCELRLGPQDLLDVVSVDFLVHCSALIDEWERDAALGSSSFRWTRAIDSEEAEFLLHGLARCVHSEPLARRITTADVERHGAFTMHLVQSLIDGLTAAGSEHLCDQVRATLGTLLDH